MQDKMFIGKRKNGQTGETITWIVATVIIIGVLIVSILVANTVFVTKKGSNDISSSKSADVFASKSVYAYVLTPGTDEKTIYEQIKSESKLNDFNGNLAKTIFEGFYGEEYSTKIWFGTNNEESSFFGIITS